MASVAGALLIVACTGGKAPGESSTTTTLPGTGDSPGGDSPGTTGPTGSTGSGTTAGSPGTGSAGSPGTGSGSGVSGSSPGTGDAGGAGVTAGDAGTATADGGAPGASDGGTLAGAGDGGTATADGGVALTPPVTQGAWTFYGSGQGLSQETWDVSADEGGNVYVAGGDAVYAKRRADTAFLRFDAASSGLTANCYATVPESDPSFNDAVNGKLHPTPPGPPILCPVISVAGAAPGQAIVGLRGIGTDGEPDADWAQESGGADVVAFDGATLSRMRHVFLASPPQTICADGYERHATSCPNPYEYFWVVGRRKLRQVHRIAVNHQRGSPLYGDAWMGGTHSTLAALLANAASRGWVDKTAGQPAKWADARDVWEHEHPAFYSPLHDAFLTGLTHAIAIQPGSGTPWGSNGFRTGYITGYGANLSSDLWWLDPVDATHPNWIDVWPDGTGDPLGPAGDNVESLSFCDDGTLWFGSSTHGLGRRDPGGGMSGVDLPDPAAHGNNAYAVACDPSDGSVWIGLGWGGVMRYRNGAFTQLDPNTPGLPDFARQPVRSIQIDRWSSPRVVYFAFMPSTDASGKVIKGGGVAAYSGP